MHASEKPSQNVTPMCSWNMWNSKIEAQDYAQRKKKLNVRSCFVLCVCVFLVSLLLFRTYFFRKNRKNIFFSLKNRFMFEKEKEKNWEKEQNQPTSKFHFLIGMAMWVQIRSDPRSSVISTEEKHGEFRRKRQKEKKNETKKST